MSEAGVAGAGAAERGAAQAPAPDAGRLERARWAAGEVLRAARLLADDAALRRAALLPTALTAAGCAVFAALTVAGDAADGEVTGPGALHVFTVTFVGLASMPPTLLQRQWMRVALEARRALGVPAGEDPFAGQRWPRMVLREWVKALRQAVVVSAGLFPVAMVLAMLPGKLATAALGAAWAFYWVLVDAFELPLEAIPGPRRGAGAPWYARALQRLGAALWLLRPFRWAGRLLARLTRPWAEEVQFTERHPWETAGFGVAVGAVLAVPGVGFFFRSIAIVAATALNARLEGDGDAAVPAAPPPA
ncbi:hypothetical protein [Anaeromyxobacter sp. K]|uniref:hypothetical protein n=1 Tax=Anaeromyxobacter sp. (strain K) TaxID=447217 RepID=UPI00015F887D|nr:hypothetical protein [Anaeromyxobacter sp. K]